ncbi:FtsX-like permease family protein [Nocardia sp. CC201C]|uniref:ABC transporter permease n=1 Tax=Nocardia sp. CC201C TaxID=3044575 RepID=UPI0024A8DB4B|nr:FtsX-like permease family protein [Nocardia sp. CC201C]
MSGSPMRKVALRNLAAHKVRLVLTVLSVVLGTAFIAGSFVFTDTLQRTFDNIFANQARGVDVRISPEEQQSIGVPLTLVDKVTAMDGVRTVAPGANGPVTLLKDGKVVQTGGAPTIGEAYLPPERAVAEPQRFVDGGPPSEPGQVAINQGGADRAGLRVGDPVTVVTPAKGNVAATISGIYQLDGGGATGGFIGLQFDYDEAMRLFTDGKHVAYLDIAARPGTDPDQLRSEIVTALPDYKVQSGDEVREDMKQQLGDALKFINYFLLAFGAIALIVGTFIIYNTFSMLVAQRLRELALLRAVGASRGQVGRSVVGEALIVGLVGSALGLAAGIGLAYGLAALLNAFDLGLPTGAMAVLPRTVAVALVLGVVVTVVSAYAPASRAARVPPVEAMREEFASHSESLRLRTIAGAVLAVIGVALVVLGAQNTGGNAAATVGIGAAALILAVLFASPALSRPVLAGLGVLVRPFGPVGRMARNNAIRNPRRTAATAFALTLGLMLVSAIGMLGASAKASVGELVDKGVQADYMLSGPPGALIGVPLQATDEVKAVPGVEEAVAFHGLALKVGGDQVFGTVPEGPLDRVLSYEIQQGSDSLGDNQILASETLASDNGWQVGQTVEVAGVDGKKYQVEVAGIYADTQLLQALVAPMSLYEQTVPTSFRSSFMVAVDAAPGTDLATLRTDLEQATEKYGNVQVMDREDFKGVQGRQIDTMLAILYGLLALAVVIAILGIVNTLALSVVERRREIGMLRAVGMQRPQVRRSIYLESMLIAIFGAVVGVILGLGLGIGFLRTLQDLGLGTIAVPWGQIVGMLIASGVVGVLAALWPAVRAARTPPLAAIADL